VSDGYSKVFKVLQVMQNNGVDHLPVELSPANWAASKGILDSIRDRQRRSDSSF
jgi:hypothetical protein